MSKNEICLIAILVIVNLFILAHAETDVKPVPNIEVGMDGRDMSEGDGIKALEQDGFLPKFYYCFSNTEKYYIIPGTQEPKANMSYVVGKEVKAGVSLGQVPVVIGLSEDESKAKLNSSGISFDVTIGRNESVKEGVVYDQYPKDATCFPKDSKMTIFVNKSAIIDKPQEGYKVGKRTVVKGRLSPDLKENEHLWIAVKPENDVQNWWPQINADGPIEAIKGTFEGNVFIGGNKNESSQIGILIIDDELNQKFLEWKNISKSEDTWPPITEGYPEKNITVSKRDIEDHIVARVNVTLSG